MVRARLLEHRHVLLERAAAAAEALSALDRIIQVEEREMEYDVRVRETTGQPMIQRRGHTPLAGSSAFMGQAYGEEFGLLGRVGVRPAGPPFAIYHDPEFREEDIDIEVGVPVGAGRRGWPRPGRARSTAGRRLHAARRAVRQSAAPTGRSPRGSEERGHEMAGPPRECYLVGVGQAKDPAEYRTEVIWPIR